MVRMPILEACRHISHANIPYMIDMPRPGQLLNIVQCIIRNP